MNLSHSSFGRQRCVRLIREHWCHGLDNCEEIRFVTSVVCIRILQIIFQMYVYIYFLIALWSTAMQPSSSVLDQALQRGLKYEKSVMHERFATFTQCFPSAPTAPSIQKLARVQEKKKKTWDLETGALCNVIWKVDQHCCSSAGVVWIARNESPQTCLNRSFYFSFFFSPFLNRFLQKRLCRIRT